MKLTILNSSMQTSFEFSGNVIGIVLEKRLDQARLLKIKEKVRERLSQFPGVRLYLEDKNNCGVDLSALLKDLMDETLRPQPLEKLAVVTDKKIPTAGAALKDLIVDCQVQTFSRKERLEALNWVTE